MVPTINLHPYYYPNSELPYGSDRGFLNFDIDQCEVCGCDVLAANSFNIIDSEHKLVSVGIKKRRPPEDEFGYCDKLEKCTCGACHLTDDE